MHAAGYVNVVHMDLCTVVIEQQRARHPALNWRVMDVMDLAGVEDESFEAVVDKSMVDTLLCCEGADDQISMMFTEAERVRWGPVAFAESRCPPRGRPPGAAPLI
jgi:hypothetical protein